MVSQVVPAVPAQQLVNVVPSVLAAGASPLQFWGLIIDANIGGNGYPMMPMGEVLLFADQADVASYFGATSQEAGLAAVYFQGPVNATKTPSGLLMAQYALNAVPGYLRGGNVSGLSLGQLQAVNATLSVTIDGSPVSGSVNLSTATSFSNAAELIGAALGVHGVQKGTINAALSGTTMTVSAFTTSNANGPLQATVTANLSGTTMTVTAVSGGYLEVGQIVQGTGISTGTTISSWNGGGQSGGVGSYTLSQAASGETGVTVTAYAATPILALGDVVTGTGLSSGTYIAAFGTGTGGAGTYTLSQAATTESAETISQFAPGVSYSSLHGTFDIHSATTGSSSSVSFATGAAATALYLTQALGAVQSPGAAASTPTAFMNSVTAQTQNWVSFMTTWEPTDADKSTNQSSSFAWWTSAQDNGYRYCMWTTNVLDTEAGGASADVAEVNTANLSGTVMVYQNPAITTLSGEKAAFSMGWAASLDFTRRNGRSTDAFKSYVGGIPDITNGTIAEYLAGAPQSGTFGYGVNFYGMYTTRSAGFPQWQRGMISGPFVWDDTFTQQIWISASLQNAIMVGLTSVGSVPYANAGYDLVTSWVLDPVLAAVNYGAIVAGVELSEAQIQDVNQQAGLDIAQTITQTGWYFQVLPAPAATRAVRASPPCTLWYADGGAIQAITLASIVIQ